MANKERIELWAKALESGRFKQTTGALKENIYDADKNSIGAEHCGLGVGVEVALENGARLDWKGETWPLFRTVNALMPRWAAEWYGLEIDGSLPTDVDVKNVCPDDGCECIDSIANLNDAGFDFWDQAQALRSTYLKDEG